jgi:signal peptidase
MATGTRTGPVGRDWLATPCTAALPVMLPSPRAARRVDLLDTAYTPFVVALPQPRQAWYDELPAEQAPVLVEEPPALEEMSAAAPAPPGKRHLASRVILGTLLNLAALLGVGMTGLTIYAATHHLHPLVVRSGSMEPLVHTGGMVLVQTIPASDIRVGDVVAAKRPDGVTVTHRVVRISRDGELANLILKGDANKAVDPDPVPVARVGRLVWSAPLIGRVAAWTASARGGFVLGCLVTGVLLSLRRRSP